MSHDNRISTTEGGHPGGPPADEPEFLAWVEENRPWLRDRVLERGAVLLRGSLTGHPQGFADFGKAFGAPAMSYVRGISPRSHVREHVFTSTDAPRIFPIPLHCEMSYTSRWPAGIAFCCQVPPRRGGRTPLSDVRQAYRDLAPDVRERFESRGVLYEQEIPRAGRRIRGWPAVFGTEVREEVEDTCRAMGIESEWGPDGLLRLREVRPAVIDHPRTGERVWFNQANLYHSSFASELRHARRPGLALAARLMERIGRAPAPAGVRVRYGDGSPIPRADVEEVRRCLWSHEFHFEWRRGDLLLLDNTGVAHGRQPYSGPRRILASLFSAWPEDPASPPGG
ncbi:MAG TPA: TauD/TfdA family dioxygenase [Gemmatimonadota bacterium]|nr:TauD/TfdA family dioxygenase [Gemmatimonadota bacterium]